MDSQLKVLLSFNNPLNILISNLCTFDVLVKQKPYQQYLIVDVTDHKYEWKFFMNKKLIFLLVK